MDSSKVPFIAEYDPYSKTRPLKQYRPLSTRPLCLSLFLAATGICFGLLLAISLIEKEPTTITKRDIHGDGNSVYERRALFNRQDVSCTSYTTAVVTSTVCVAPSGYVCPTTTTEPAAATTDPCAVTMTTVTTSYLSLTTQDPTTQSPTTLDPTTSTLTTLTSTTLTPSSATSAVLSSATSGGAYLSLNDQCTSTVTEMVTVCSPLSGYVCPSTTPTTAAAAASTGSCVTVTLTETKSVVGSYLSLTTQESTTPTTVPTLVTTTGTDPGAYLSLNDQCTSTFYIPVTVTVCSPPSGYTCPPTTSAAAATAAAATGSCSTTRITVYTTIQASYLALTTQDPTSILTTPTTSILITSEPAKSTIASEPSSGESQLSLTESYLTLANQDPTTTSTGSSLVSTASTSASSGSYLVLTASDTPKSTIASTLTSTGSYLVLTASDSPKSTIASTSTSTGSYLALTTPNSVSSDTSAASYLTSGSYVVLTAPKSTSTGISSVVASASSSAYLVLTTPDPTSTATGSYLVLTTESYLVLTASGSTWTSTSFMTTQVKVTSTPPLSSKTTSDPVYESSTPQEKTTLLSTTANSYLYISGQSTMSSTPAIVTELSSLEGTLSQSSTIVDSFTTSGLVPLVNSVASESQTAYTITLPHSTEIVSMSPGEQTTLTASGATYLIVASTDGIHSSLYTEQSGTSTASSVTITSAQPTSTSVNSTLNQNIVLIKLKPFHTYYYFLALYLPKIIAVIMTALWTIIFAGLKLMEPFYQLSANTGAFASESMFGNYLASETSISSLSATFRGRWVLLLGGTVLIVWAAIVALVSESMNVISQGTCTDLNNPESKPYRCNPGWVVNQTIVKVLLALTGFVFVLVLGLMLILGQRKRTGVYHDPSSIAAMAELLGNPTVMEDLQAIKPSSSDQEVRLLLGENRYRIGLYDPHTGKDASFSPTNHHELRWGLIKHDQTPLVQTIADRRLPGYSAVLNPSIVSTEERQANRKRRIFQLVYDTVMLLTALCIFGLVLGYYLDAKSDPLNDFFNSDTWGPRLVLTCLALILSIGWRKTSQETTVMAPYRGMAKAYEAQSGVMASRSVLAAIAHNPWTALYRGLQLRYYMVSIVALCAVLADLLLIAVSGVPYRESQVVLSLKVCAFASLGILGIMILTSLAVIIHNKTSAGGTRRLPRSPNTLIGVWLYLCHSNIVNHDHGPDDLSSPLTPDELVAKYEKYQYGFTRKPGIDRVGRWTVDTVIGLRSWSLPPTHRYQQQQNHQSNDVTEQQGPQPFEASATPVEQTLQDPFIHRAVSRRQPNTSPYGVPYSYFEAQAKSPVAQAPPARFEELRQGPPVARVTPTPQIPPIRRQESDPTMHEALAQWEYEQEFHDARRMSAGSRHSDARWTNDGRSQYRYG